MAPASWDTALRTTASLLWLSCLKMHNLNLIVSQHQTQVEGRWTGQSPLAGQDHKGQRMRLCHRPEEMEEPWWVIGTGGPGLDPGPERRQPCRWVTGTAPSRSPAPGRACAGKTPTWGAVGWGSLCIISVVSLWVWNGFKIESYSNF